VWNVNSISCCFPHCGTSLSTFQRTRLFFSANFLLLITDFFHFARVVVTLVSSQVLALRSASCRDWWWQIAHWQWLHYSCSVICELCRDCQFVSSSSCWCYWFDIVCPNMRDGTLKMTSLDLCPISRLYSRFLHTSDILSCLELSILIGDSLSPRCYWMVSEECCKLVSFTWCWITKQLFYSRLLVKHLRQQWVSRKHVQLLTTL